MGLVYHSSQFNGRIAVTPACHPARPAAAGQSRRAVILIRKIKLIKLHVAMLNVNILWFAEGLACNYYLRVQLLFYRENMHNLHLVNNINMQSCRSQNVQKYVHSLLADRCTADMTACWTSGLRKSQKETL